MNARSTFYSLAAAALAATLVVAGCGGGGDSMESTSTEAPVEPSRFDVCALLTTTDIEEALGVIAEDSDAGDEGLGQCMWAAPDGSGNVVVVTLDNAVLGSFDEFVTAFGEEFGGENPPRDEYHPVDGVPGDWAMYVAEEHTVRAFRGGEVLEVSSPGAAEEQVVDLAARAMAQLP